MAKINIKDLDETQQVKLVNARWASSDTVWDIVSRVYKQNTEIYENKAEYLSSLPEKRRKNNVQANRIFVNMEAVINSLIANIPGLNIIPSHDGEEAKELARKLEAYLLKKYTDRNFKEVVRMGLRNLYFARLLSIKAFWNPTINDFDFRAVDPRKIRIGKYARKEQDSEFAIEEIEDNLCAVIERFPAKQKELMDKFGFNDTNELAVKNPEVKYKEAWIGDDVIFVLDTLHLGTIRNPDWDWDGILITEEEAFELNGDGTSNNRGLEGEKRRALLQTIKREQETRRPKKVEEGSVSVEGESVDQEKAVSYQAYNFNYFDTPRKPYIFATIFNNENSPIGRTDMITLAAPLQYGIDKRKMDIDENCEMATGILKVDSGVMGKSDAQRIRFETKGIVWGKGVKDGVTRETGAALPAMVFDDMIDSRNEIDNIMAATSAFRGERQGQETKAGRLALIQQSFLRLNELVQVVDYVAKEMFDWGLQFAKTRYTESHYAKTMGKEGARETVELIQDDITEGNEVTIIAGKTLPKDDEFKFEQAQNDVAAGLISPVDYLEIAQYDNSKTLAKNAVLYKQNPMQAVGIESPEMPLPFTPGTPTLNQMAPLQEIARTPVA